MFLETKAQANELLRFWKATLLSEESLGKSLTPVHPSVAKLEGRPYYKIPFKDFEEDERLQSFILREQSSWKEELTAEHEPFLTYLHASDKQRKKFRQEGERNFMVGFPALLHKDRFGNDQLTTLVKFPLVDLSYPNINGATVKGAKLILGQETFAPKKGEFAYWIDELFLSEALQFTEEQIQEFRKALLKEKHSCFGFLCLLTEHLLGKTLPEEATFATLVDLLHEHLQGLSFQGKSIPVVFPMGLVYELENNQPTKQLQNDLDEIQSEDLIGDLSQGHPAWRFLMGNARAPEVSHPFMAGPSASGLTESQNEAIAAALGQKLTVIQGPPGTGKTHLIRGLMGQRFVEFVNGLSKPESRAFDLEHVTLVLSTNNRAVDNAMEGLEEEGLLPISIRLGSRIVMGKTTLPFLQEFCDQIEEKSVSKSKTAFQKYHKELQERYNKALAADQEGKEPDGKEQREIYLLARRCHDAWIGANQNKLLDLLEELISEIAEKRGLRSLKSYRNLQFLLTAFPVVGCTLLSLRNLFELEESSLGMVVIDEAGQCTPSYMFPALLRAKQAVILGDQMQLEPVSRMRLGELKGLAKSKKIDVKEKQIGFFSTSLESPRSGQEIAEQVQGNVFRLKEHFRCQKEIIQVSQELCGYDLHYMAPEISGPALQYVSVEGQEEVYGGSWFNPIEVKAAVQLASKLISEGTPIGEIALLTPYRGQLYHFNHELQRVGIPHFLGESGQTDKEAITTGTVHRFQGGERKVVIFCPVIAMGQPKFLNSKVNLLNVALSRAKERFILVGSLEALGKGPITARLQEHLIKNGHRIIL